MITPCYNEEENVRPLYEEVREVFKHGGYSYSHLFIDNASRDKTGGPPRIRGRGPRSSGTTPNAGNFGQIRSPYHALLQAKGDAIFIVIAADFQDPPCLIAEFLQKWESGFKVVMVAKVESDESRILYALRTGYYNLVAKMANVELPRHVTGFGLYDRKIIEVTAASMIPIPISAA